MELKRRFEQSMKDAADKYQGLNLYLKNLDDSIADDQLRELFSNFGKITSCKVMRDQNGVSKGSGFVAFSTREEASQALTEMNGKMISGKPLYVAFAQRKEERKAMLQAQFSQMRPVPMTPSMAPRLPMYPPMAPLGQQLFYGQAPPAIIPPQPGFGFQQQLVPGMRPGGAHMPNYFVPVVQQGQQGPRPGLRRSGAVSAQGQQSAQSFQQQMLPRGRVYRYPPGRSMPDVPLMPGVAPGGMIQLRVSPSRVRISTAALGSVASRRKRRDDSTREARRRKGKERKKKEDKGVRRLDPAATSRSPDPPFPRADPGRRCAYARRRPPRAGSRPRVFACFRSSSQICDPLAPGHMTPTVLMECVPQRQIKRSYDELAFRGVAAAAPRGYAETVGELQGAAGSPVRVDSEDSSAPKRKCISLNSDGFDVKREIFVPSKMSSSERRYLRKRFRAELDSVRDLLKKPEFSVPVPVNRAPAFSSSAASRGKKGQRGSHVVRGAKGRFLPTKSRPETCTVLSEATVLKQCEAILKKLMTHKYSHIFNAPVDVVKLQIPDYFDIIKHPMDLSTIKKKLESGSYTSPSDFAADVRLTFTNAMTYNPRGHAVHDMAIQLNKMFETRWKTIEKKLASATTEPHVEVDRADSKRRKTPPVDCSDVSMECVRPTESVKPKMTFDEKEAFGNCLASLSEDPELPAHIIDLLQQCIDNNTDQLGDGEIEIDIHAVSDDILFELKKHVDKYLQEREQSQQVKSEPSENEAVNVSGLSHSSTNPCKGGEPVEEDVDICGNASPILLEKDGQIRASKCGSPSSSSSDSGSSSSDSDSGSDTESESEKVGSPAKLAKGNKRSEHVEQEKSDVISPVDANRPVDDVELREQDSESKPAPEGDNSKPDRQVSPDKLLRAALLRSRYADVIVKARGILSQGGDKQEELEKLQKEEKARLLAEGNAAMEARRAEAEAEAKRKRDLEREKFRQALQEVERTVEINDNLHPKDLEMLGTATAEHIVSSVDETSPEHSQDGMPSFLPGSGNPLEQLGLFMKADDEEEEEEPSSVPSIKVAEEGEIN